jgi:hypothetical protein
MRTYSQAVIIDPIFAHGLHNAMLNCRTLTANQKIVLTVESDGSTVPNDRDFLRLAKEGRPSTGLRARRGDPK